MLLSMLLAVLLGQPAFEPVAAAASAPGRPTIEISLADTLRALPASAASANGSFLQDDCGSGDGPPVLARCARCLPLSAAEAIFAFRPAPATAGHRPTANRARAPPAA